MKKKQIILSALAVTGAVVGAFAFADTSISNSVSDTVKTATDAVKNIGVGRMGHRGFSGENIRGDMLSKFIDKDSLTDEQKTALETLQKDHMTKVQELMSSIKDSSSDTDKSVIQEQMKTLRTEYLNSVRQYVSSDKLTEFDEFVKNSDNMPMMGERGEGHRGGRGEMGGMMGGAERFIDKDSLTDEQKSELETIMSGHRQKMQELKTEYLNSIKKFVSTDKVADFEKAIENEGKMGQQMGGRGMGMMGIGLQKYIDVDNLSGDAKTTYDNAVKAFQDTMKSNMQSAKDNTGDKTQMQESMKSAWTIFMQSIRSLVPSDKLSDFDAFVTAGPQAPKQGMGMMRNRGNQSATTDDTQTQNQ